MTDFSRTAVETAGNEGEEREILDYLHVGIGVCENKGGRLTVKRRSQV